MFGGIPKRRAESPAIHLDGLSSFVARNYCQAVAFKLPCISSRPGKKRQDTAGDVDCNDLR